MARTRAEYVQIPRHQLQNVRSIYDASVVNLVRRLPATTAEPRPLVAFVKTKRRDQAKQTQDTYTHPFSRFHYRIGH
jgi:hypothetical protein